MSSNTLKSVFSKLFIPWFVLIIIISILLYKQLFDTAIKPLENISRINISKTSNIIYRSMGNIKRDLTFLSNNLVVQDSSFLENSNDVELLANFFKAFSEASGLYDQIRWIDNSGMELIRVNLKKNKAIIVPPEQLQSKAKRYYFLNSLKLNKNELYFSPVDLNIEHGKIEVPWKPIIRAIIPIYNQEETRTGFIVLNYLAGGLLNDVRKSNIADNINFFLVNKEGYWLLSPIQNQEWGFMFSQPELNMKATYPSSWNVINQKERGSFFDQYGMWHFESISLNDKKQNIFHWKAIIHLPQNKISEIFYKTLLQIVAIAITFILLAFFVCLKISKNIVKIKEINNELTQSKKELEESLAHLKETQDELIQVSKLSSMGLMVAGVAHELNTPIGSAQITLTSLNDDCVEFEKAYLKGLCKSDVDNFIARYNEGSLIIQSNLTRSANLVKSFKRLAVERRCEEEKYFNLSLLIDDLHRAIWSQNNDLAKLIIITIPKFLEVKSFPGAIGQVVENLVSNAFIHGLHSKPHGEILITASKTDTSAQLLIEVSDNGCGIEEEPLSSIFEPFYTTRRGSGGMGLGLHLTFQLVTQVLKGTLNVESELNVGTKFIVKIPLAD
ncbi:ATP-binding protein [Aliikangiella sp. IMCC44359]|uniref:ATP-binding protein n=1 Tax=Aliikangiella sp. IMCC44359 TaxID=3459125 RepID=UPI00403AD45A